MNEASMEFPQTLHDAIKYFSTGDNALNFMVALALACGRGLPSLRIERSPVSKEP